MDAKRIKTTRALLICGIPIVIAATISLYFLFDNTICNGEGQSHLYCGLVMIPISAFLGLFGLVFIFVCLSQLTKKNQAIIQNSKDKTRVIYRILGRTLLWTILITAFVIGLFGTSFASRDLPAAIIMAIIAITSLIAMCFLIASGTKKH